jgi:hypothetical protein
MAVDLLAILKEIDGGRGPGWCFQGEAVQLRGHPVGQVISDELSINWRANHEPKFVAVGGVSCRRDLKVRLQFLADITRPAKKVLFAPETGHAAAPGL